MVVCNIQFESGITGRPELMNFDTKIRYAPGVGAERAKSFNKLGVHTIRDLLEHYPRDYVLPTDAVKISEMQLGKNAIITGRIMSVEYDRYSRIPKFIITVADDTGTCRIVWYNGGWLRNQLQVGQMITLSGRAEIEK